MGKGVEIERKFIIKIPDLSRLSSDCEYSESRIVQIYLESEKGITHRVRSRSYEDKTVYTETKKTRIDKMSAFEEEREISEEEFKLLSGRIRSGSRPVVKRRLVFFYLGSRLEIDVYPDWERTAIMEIELSSRDEKINVPPYIEIISEVTGDGRYSNSALAHSFPEESI